MTGATNLSSTSSITEVVHNDHDTPPQHPETIDIEKGQRSQQPQPETQDGSAATPPNGVVGNDDAAAAPAPTDPEASRTKAETITIMVALCIALFLAALDMTIVTTAIPTIAAEFQSNAGYVWIGTAYMLANAAVAPTWGKISDIWGLKPVLLAAVAVFWIGSLVCGLSNGVGMMLAGRAVQGIGGGGVIVLVNICIGHLFSVRNRGLYYGMLGGVWSISSAIGPIIGGAFTTEVTWRWCFYINLPVSGVAFIVLVFVLKLHNPRTPLVAGLKAVDWLGSVLIMGGTLMLLFGLEFGGVNHPWNSAIVICLIVFGAVTFIIFGLYEWKVPEHPVIPTRILQSRSNLAALGLVFCHGFVFMGGSYWLPLYFQAILGVNALMSGVYLLPYVLGLSIMSIATGIVIKKTGNFKLLMIAGTVIMTLGFGLLIDLSVSRHLAKLIIFQLIAGLGVGPNFQSPLIALHSQVQGRDIATATSLLGFVRQLAAAISVVIGGVVFNNEMEKRADYLQEELGPELAGRLSGANAASNVELVASLGGHDGEVARGAFWDSMRIMWAVYVAFAGLGVVLALLVRQRRLSKDHTEHKTGLAGMNEAAAAAKAAKADEKAAA
jgi:EmrB/QacA subfamily drug resistance transporter